MAVVLVNAARSAACDAVVTLLNGGSIQMLTSANAVLATLTLPNPAFGAAVNGVATMNTVPAATATGTGTASKATFRNSSGTTIYTVTVATTGADINLSSVSISNGDSVQITSYTHTQPA